MIVPITLPARDCYFAAHVFAGITDRGQAGAILPTDILPKKNLIQ
jgi:hypothetical protein